MSDQPAADQAAAVRRKQAHNDYVQDQLQQERTTIDHAATLKARAPHRIAAMKAARTDAGLTPAPTPGDDPLSHFHTVERMLDERAFYPPHDKRTESADYARVHHQMTVVDDKHCLVCGVRHSTLGDPAKNPFGAVQIETHHHTIEWALANAIDPDKFNQHILPGLKRLAANRAAGLNGVYSEFDPLYAAPMSQADILKWVDHAADNLWPLCDVHHRHKFVGVHAITYPIWGPQDVVSAELIAQEIDAAKGAPAI